MKLFSLLLISLISCFGFSQSKKQVAFRELTVEQGLSQNSVVSIAQDRTGFMWFATQDGLNKYDGRNFVHYDIQFEDVTRPRYSKLGKIYVDKTGQLWIVSNSGRLQKFDHESNTFKSQREYLHYLFLVVWRIREKVNAQLMLRIPWIAGKISLTSK